ncbi:hypothetical protein BRO54_1496 [Geobacillus proteiniphilus]|uniref:Uncharacterized protein n=1 Tax=Geobacillus proteiniphilus TaxID=860353 RepID=A0A1Q5T333_9BACL|nr:hypothetical protein [Geobacillus proteiniphilus]OKO94617.1 hypothetical protein BRO54_1496 [Geobacillus proteiniphilus]
MPERGRNDHPHMFYRDGAPIFLILYSKCAKDNKKPAQMQVAPYSMDKHNAY